MNLQPECVRHRTTPSGCAARGYSAPRAEALAPLRVRPFGRLLASYTVNELGRLVGIVALALLVFDRTEARRAHRGVLHRREVPAGAVRARADRAPRPARAAARAAGALPGRGARLRRARAARRSATRSRSRRARARRSSTARSRSPAAGSRAARSRPCCSRTAAREGNALMNLGFAVASVGGAALAAASDRGVRRLRRRCCVDAASFLVIARAAGAQRATCPRRARRARAVARRASAPASRSRAATATSARCCSGRRSRSSSSR